MCKGQSQVTFVRNPGDVSQAPCNSVAWDTASHPHQLPENGQVGQASPTIYDGAAHIYFQGALWKGSVLWSKSLGSSSQVPLLENGDVDGDVIQTSIGSMFRFSKGGFMANWQVAMF